MTQNTSQNKRKPAKWFSYDPCGDEFQFHDSADDAKEAAISVLDSDRDHASTEGWHDDTQNTCWGAVVEQVQETLHVIKPDDFDGWTDEAKEEFCENAGMGMASFGSFDSYGDYALLPANPLHAAAPELLELVRTFVETYGALEDDRVSIGLFDGTDAENHDRDRAMRASVDAKRDLLDQWLQNAAVVIKQAEGNA